MFSLIICMLALCLSRCTADLCNWTGSGFSAGKDSKLVLQVRLRCAAGWVRWVYPDQGLRVVLEPNLSNALCTTVCIKPSPSLRGASVFLERPGRLHLLAIDRASPEQVMCFRADGVNRSVIYLQARAQSDEAWSSRTVGFRYELLTNRTAAASPNQRGLEDLCRPCDNTELLMAICNSDFVVRGSIKNVSHDSVRQTSLVEVSVSRVYWQHGGVFEEQAAHHELSMSMSPSPAPSWRGNIYTFLQCHIKPGGGEFLFTGSEHFGEAWLGCAPRFKDFLSVYHSARAARRNSCDFPLD